MVDEAIKAAETYYGNDYRTLFLATEIIDYCARDGNFNILTMYKYITSSKISSILILKYVIIIK